MTVNKMQGLLQDKTGGCVFSALIDWHGDSLFSYAGTRRQTRKGSRLTAIQEARCPSIFAAEGVGCKQSILMVTLLGRRRRIEML